MTDTPSPLTGVNPPRFSFPQADGSDDQRLSAQEVRAASTPRTTPDGTAVVCMVCGKNLNPAGFGIHFRSHLVTIGDKEKLTHRGGRKKKAANKLMDEAAEAPAKPKAQQKISVDDACIGMLMGMTGKKNIPIEKLPAVSAWIEQTKKLMEEL